MKRSPTAPSANTAVAAGAAKPGRREASSQKISVDTVAAATPIQRNPVTYARGGSRRL